MPPVARSLIQVLSITAVAAIATHTIVAQNQQRPVFRSDVNFITVDAYPLIDGRVVEGLTVDDFEVLEDGRPQRVESFDFVRADERMTSAERRDPRSQSDMLEQLKDPRSRAFVAYLDVHHVGLSGAFYSREPLIELFQRILAPGDLIALATSQNQPRALTFGRTTDVVEEQLRRHWTWRDPDVTVNDAEELTLFARCSRDLGAPVGELLARRRQDQVLSNLQETVDYLGTVREGRKMLFLFSRGWPLFEPNPDLLKEVPGYLPSTGPPVVTGRPPNQPPGNNPNPNMYISTALAEGSRAACEQELIRLAHLDTTLRFRQLINDARANNVVIYPVNPAGVGAVGDKNDRLLELASGTGGTAVYNRNDLLEGVINVSREFAAYYLLGYATDNPATDGRLRRIEVKVRRPGVTVKARQGYRALSKAEAASKAAVLATPIVIDAARADVDAALDSLARVRPTDALFVYPARTATGIAVAVELAAGQVGPAWTVDVQATHASTGDVLVARGRIAAGGRHAEVAVRGAGLSARWHVTARARSNADEIVEGSADTAASARGEVEDIRVYRRRSAEEWTPAGQLLFARSERARFESGLGGDASSAQLRVLDRTGAVVPAQVTAAVEPAPTRAVGELTLAALAPGDYVAELTVGVDGEAVRRLVAFRVVR
jgi:VWFA-related protein